MQSDYISRQAAIHNFKTKKDCLRQWVEKEDQQRIGLNTAIAVVKDLPAADVVPVVHGKWIDHDGNEVQLNEHGEPCGTCFCNRCGEWLVASDEYDVKGYFCPNCGAKMYKE